MNDGNQSKTDKQDKNSFNWLDEYKWQKGQSWNPKGRPKEKTLKEFAREFLSNMSEEARLNYFSQLDPEVVWKMAEGMPSTHADITSKWNQITGNAIIFKQFDGADNQ